MSNTETQGGLPAVTQPVVGSQAILVPVQKRGPTTVQVVGGFLAAAAIIAGGVIWVADAVYLRQSKYTADREVAAEKRESDIRREAQLSANVQQNTQTTSDLKTSVDKLSEKIGAMNTPRPRRSGSDR